MRQIKKILFSALLFLLFSAKTVFGADGLEVHFIDVGQADAALVISDGHAMMIDGGSDSDSQLIYSYLKKQKIEYLDYIIASHSDADHVGGLSGAVSYAGSNIGTVFAPYTKSSKERFQTFQRKLAENGKLITVPKVGDSYPLGSATFRILSAAGEEDKANLTLRLQYGKHSFLFTGDADSDLEKQMISTGLNIESTVLKVGHHGSKSSTSYQFLREVDPSYAVIPVGKGNSYGHPTDDVLSRLRDQGATVYRTDNNGTIIFTSDGKNLSVKSEKTYSQEQNLIASEMISNSSTAGTAITRSAAINSNAGTSTYVLNTNTKKFHRPGCSSVNKMKEKNKKIVEDTRDHIISQGYDPCKNCSP